MKFYYFNSTHWDREWYQPYQEFRKYLVDAARELLRIFDTESEFRRFTFDGQTIVLEDITEIRPDWRPKLEELIRSGRLNVGPWYVMPDEFLVSGEAMIRNLQAGRRIAANTAPGRGRSAMPAISSDTSPSCRRSLRDSASRAPWSGAERAVKTAAISSCGKARTGRG